MAKSSIIPAKLDNRGGNLNKQWFIYYSIRQADGKMRRKRDYQGLNYGTGEERMARAKNMLDAINEKLLAGFDPWAEKQQQLTAQDISLKNALERAYETRIRNLRYKTISTYKSKLRVFCHWLDTTGRQYITMHQFTQADAKSFLQSLQLNNTTINYYKAQLESFFDDFVKNGHLYKNPFAGIPMLKENRQPKLPFRQQEVDLLKPYIMQHYPDLWLHIEFICYMATRPNETRLIKISDIDFHNQQLWVQGNVAKNNKTQHIDFPEHFFKKIEYLSKLPGSWYIFGQGNKSGPKPRKRDYYNRLFRNILIEKGIDTERYSLYSWKHTGAVRSARAGISPKDLQGHFRHADLSTTDIYLHGMGAYPSDSIRTKIPVL